MIYEQVQQDSAAAYERRRLIHHGTLCTGKKIVSTGSCVINSKKDWLPAGLKDSAPSERMPFDKDLTIAKAITVARQWEEIKRQQTDLRGDMSTAEPQTLSRQGSCTNMKLRKKHRVK